jgi:hypothetical protein
MGIFISDLQPMLFQYSKPKIGLTLSDIICVGLYIFWTQILRGFRISSQNCRILSV